MENQYATGSPLLTPGRLLCKSRYLSATEIYVGFVLQNVYVWMLFYQVERVNVFRFCSDTKVIHDQEGEEFVT